MTKYTIFDPKTYKTNLYFPVICIFFCFFEFFIFLNLTPLNYVGLQFVMDIVFLNAIHILFTFIYIFSLKEFRLFISEYKLKLKRDLYKEWIFAFLLLFIFFWFFFEGYPLSQEFNVFHLLNMVTFAWAALHAISQSVGLSSVSLLERCRHFEKSELSRPLKYNSLILPIVFAGYLVMYLFCFLLKITLTYNLKIIFSALLILYIFFHFIFIYRKLSRNFVLDFVFGLRYILYIMSFYSVAANFGRAVVHGHESYMIYKKLVPNTYFSLKKVFNFKPIVVFFLIFGLISIFLNARSGVLGFFTEGQHPRNLAYQFLFSFFYALTYLHFFIESQIYKFSDPLVNKNQGALFRS